LKPIRYIGQLLAAVLYSGVFAGLFYAVNLIPLWLFLQLGLFWAIVVLLALSALMKPTLQVVRLYAQMPYIWICYENLLARIISAVIVVVSGLAAIGVVWTLPDEYGWKLIAVGLYITAHLIANMAVCLRVVWSKPEAVEHDADGFISYEIVEDEPAADCGIEDAVVIDEAPSIASRAKDVEEIEDAEVIE